MAPTDPNTSGERLFLIRAALGHGPRDPMPMREFADLVARETGERYDPATISLLERNKQGWRLKDVRAFAAVDPLRRGAAWLSALEDDPGSFQLELPDPRKDRKLTEEELARAREQAARERAERAVTAQNSGRRRPRRGGKD